MISPKIYNPYDFNARPASKKAIPKFLVILIFALIFACVLVYLFFYSPIFQIKNILIEGSVVSLPTQLENLKGKNIFLVDVSDVNKNVSEEFPEISELKVSRGLPDTLKISLNERTSKLVWQTQGKEYLVDSEGEIFKEIDGQGDLPLVKDNKDLDVILGGQVVTENFINFVTTLNNNLSQKTELIIDHFEVNETTFQVDAVTSNGWKIIFDTTSGAESQLDDLKTFLIDHQSEVQEYIDLRVEGRVYYK